MCKFKLNLNDVSQESGVDCVKFQKSSLADKFTGDALGRPYTSANSWGNTYGAHKSHLEFSIDQFRTLQSYAKKIGILFSASAMDLRSLTQLYTLDLPFIKIGSGDANNFQLLQYAAARTTPLVISTGMQNESTIRKIVEIMQNNGKQNYCLMHCVSSYPTEVGDTRIRMVEVFAKMFPNVCIGYSGHEQSTAAITGAAVILGAKVCFTKQHSRGWKLKIIIHYRSSNVISHWTRHKKEQIISSRYFHRK